MSHVIAGFFLGGIVGMSAVEACWRATHPTYISPVAYPAVVAVFAIVAIVCIALKG